MADPTGTVGLPKESQGDLALAAGGGSRFMARLQQLGDAADRLERAAAKVRLGDNIEAALQQAQGKLNDADQKQQQATEVLADAQARAKDIVDQADKERATAEELRRNAEAQLERAREKEQQAIAAADVARAAGAKAALAQSAAAAVERKFAEKISRLKTALSGMV